MRSEFIYLASLFPSVIVENINASMFFYTTCNNSYLNLITYSWLHAIV